MTSNIFIGVFAALLVFGLPGAIPHETLPVAPSKEAKTDEKPVMLGDQILFQLATETEGFAQAKRVRDVSKRIKRIADSPRFNVDLITTNDSKAPI